jgi:uncharacterized membrane-anchored protein YhcB (DUF1043 family)
MSTAAQQKASRQNGVLSNGPVTLEGKARSARNATRHGLTGGPVVLPCESQEEYDAFLQSTIDTWGPSTLAQLDLVHQMATARWRMRRIEPMEAAILTEAYERQMEAMGKDADRAKAMQRAYADVAENSKGWRNLNRHYRTLQKAYADAYQALLEQGEREDDMRAAQSKAQAQRKNSPAVQNEPEPEYSSSRSTAGPNPSADTFMPQMLAGLAKMNAGESPQSRTSA